MKMLKLGKEELTGATESLVRMIKRVNDKLKSGLYAKCFEDDDYIELSDVGLIDDVLSLLLDKMNKTNDGWFEKCLQNYVEELILEVYKVKTFLKSDKVKESLSLYLNGDKEQLNKLGGELFSVEIPLNVPDPIENFVEIKFDEEPKSNYEPQSDK